MKVDNEKVKEYFKKHRVPDVVEDLLHALLYESPHDPVAFMIEHLKLLTSVGPTLREKYLIGHTLGTGHSSTVRHGTCRATRLEYAIKIIDLNVVRQNGKEEQLQREVHIIENLHHPNATSVREALKTNDHYFIVMELVTGGELFQKIAQSPMQRIPEAQARNYFQQLVAAVRYCHKRGVAHRDLKPENLLLTEDGRLKVSDFGLSALQSSSPSGRVPPKQRLKSIVGSPHYLAPEVLMGIGYDGFLADVWSCGVILFVMLSGEMPFEGPTIPGVLNKIVRGNFEIPTCVPEEAADLLRQILVKKPAKRVKLDQVMAHPWFQQPLDTTAFLDTTSPKLAACVPSPGAPSSTSNPPPTLSPFPAPTLWPLPISNREPNLEQQPDPGANINAAPAPKPVPNIEAPPGPVQVSKEPCTPVTSDHTHNVDAGPKPSFWPRATA